MLGSVRVHLRLEQAEPDAVLRPRCPRRRPFELAALVALDETCAERHAADGGLLLAVGADAVGRRPRPLIRLVVRLQLLVLVLASGLGLAWDGGSDGSKSSTVIHVLLHAVFLERSAILD